MIIKRPSARLIHYVSGLCRMSWHTTNRLAMIESFVRRSVGASKLPLVWELDHHLRVLVRDPMDIWIAQECLLERVYERASVALQDGWTLLDIGAGIGDFALLVATTCPNSQIVACEPDRESFLLLQRNLALNGITHLVIQQIAVADTCGQTYLCAHGRSSVYGSTLDASGKGQRIEVQGLESLLDSFGWQQCDFVKMDCEGGEYAIVLGSSDHTLRRVRRWCLEYHDQTDYTHADLVRRFEALGFLVRAQANVIHPHTGYLYAYQPHSPAAPR